MDDPEEQHRIHCQDCPLVTLSPPPVVERTLREELRLRQMILFRRKRFALEKTREAAKEAHKAAVLEVDKAVAREMNLC